MGNQVLAPLDFPIAALVQQQIRSKGVDLRLNTPMAGFTNETNQLKVLLKSGEAIDADMVILSIGVRPDTRLAIQAALKIGAAKDI